MIEVLPQPFFLKKIRDRNAVGEAFRQLLKAAPSELHIKSVAMPANMKTYIQAAEKDIASEQNDNCRAMGQEYIERLRHAEQSGVMRRFFISFPYEGKASGYTKEAADEAVWQLNIDAERIAASLAACGNETVPYERSDPNGQTARIFYTLLNRRTSAKVPFEEHAAEVGRRYFERCQNEDFYIPPADVIAPKRISFRDGRYVTADGTYYSFLYIPNNGYNPLVVTGWLDSFVNSFVGVDVDIFLRKSPKEEHLADIRRKIGHQTVNVDTPNRATEGFAASSAALEAGYYMLNGLNAGQDFYDIGIIITASGDSPAEADFKANELKKTAARFDIRLRDLRWQEEAAFMSVLPLCEPDEELFRKIKRNALTEGAASVYPFTTFQMLHENGTYFADDMATGAPVIVDPFDRSVFNNPHIFVCGETGAGKSVTIQLLALRNRIRHIPVFILAPEKQDEFRRLCEAVGGQFVSIGTGSPSRINIMEIFMKERSGQARRRLIDGSDGTQSQLAEKVSSLLEFFQLYITDMDLEEKQLLDEAIVRTYAHYGITHDNDSLWADEKKRAYKTMPILSDLIRELEQIGALRIARIAKALTVGAGQHFNGRTNIDVENDFFVIGLENNTEDFLGLSIYAAMEYCWTKIKEDRTRNKLLIIDEWWKMAFDPIAANKSLEISKLARAYGCSMVIATQQMSDILAVENGKYGNAVLNNCAAKILMGMKKKDIDSVRDMVGLTDAECRRIERFKAGQGLFIAGENRMPLQFNPSETEKLLTFTDHDTLLRYAELQRQKYLAGMRGSDAEMMEDIFGKTAFVTEDMDTSDASAKRFIDAELIPYEAITQERFTLEKEGENDIRS